MMHTIQDIQWIILQSPSPGLSVLEKNTALHELKRIFIVTAGENTLRGKHAHKSLTQLLLCVHGVCEVNCDDGKNKKKFLLNSPIKGLLIPPGIWAEQLYCEQETTLLVVCDDVYDESDYIRSYERFLKYRETA